MTLISFPDIVVNARQDKGKRFISFKKYTKEILVNH